MILKKRPLSVLLAFLMLFTLLLPNASLAASDQPAPAVTDVSVRPGTIVETLAAYVIVSASSENLGGEKLYAYLQVGSELLYETELKDGTARMYVPAAPVAGTYDVVVKDKAGLASGKAPIEVTEYDLSIWSATAHAGEGGYIYLSFSEPVSTKTGYKSKVNEAAVKCSQYAAAELKLDAIADELPAGPISVEVSGVKYPRLFPSYSFTFKASFTYKLAPTTMKFTMLGTTDIHGRGMNYDYATAAGNQNYGLVRVASYVKKVRSEVTNVLLQDNGDLFQGTTMSVLYLTKYDVEHPLARLMRHMGYDSWVLGNHEFNYGLGVLDNFIADMEAPADDNGTPIPTLSANTYKTEDGSNYVHPYIIKPMTAEDGSTINVGVLGLTTPNIPSWDLEQNWKGLEFRGQRTQTGNMADEVNKWVPIMKADGADVIILSFHSGLESAGSSSNADQVRAAVAGSRGVDAVLYGHDHSRNLATISNLDGKPISAINPGGPSAQYMSRIDFVINRDEAGAIHVSNVSPSNIQMNDANAPVDEDALKILSTYHQAALDYDNQVIGEAGEAFPNPSIYQPSALVDIVHQAQLRWSGAQVSITAPLTLNVKWAKGPLSVKDAGAAYIYENTLYNVKMTAANIKGWMEYVAGNYSYNSETGNFGYKGSTYNADSLCGITYDVDLSKPTGSRIVNMRYQGRLVTMDQEFIVCINNYRFAGQCMTAAGLTQGDMSLVTWDSQVEMGYEDGQVRSMVINYVREKGTVYPTIYTDWKLSGTEVPVETENIELGASALTLTQGVGQTSQLTWTGFEGQTPVFSSSNENVATVSAAGLVTVTGMGDAVITARIGRAYSTCAVTVKEDVKKLTLLSFNDYHGTIDAAAETSSSGVPGLAKFAGGVKREVANTANETLVLATGDNYQGTAVSNLNLGRPVNDMMKAIGVKYSAIGNHEFDWTNDLFDMWQKEGDFTFLCANMELKATGEIPSFCKPYAIYTAADGLRVGILGLITKETPSLVKAANVADFNFINGVDAAKKYVPLMQAEGCDFIIALAHMGGSECDNLAYVEGIDAVYGGHTHSTTNKVVNGVPVIQSYTNGRLLGRIDLEYNLTTGLKKVTANNIDFQTRAARAALPVDEGVKAMVDAYNAASAPMLDVVVGYHETGLTSSSQVYDWADELVYAYILKETGVNHVVIQNSGGWRSQGIPLPQGDITVRYMYSLMPFDNAICLMDMTGAQLIKHYEQQATTLDDKGNPKNLGSKGLIWGMTKRDGKYYMTSGETEVEVLDSTEITYRVACNDFMITGGDNFDFVTGVTNVTYMGVALRDGMIEVLKSRLPVTKLTVLSFNDFHGAIDEASGSRGNPGLAKLADSVLKEKANAVDPANVLMLNTGDTFQGSAVSNLNRGKPVNEMLKYIGTQYFAIGNHDFDWLEDGKVDGLFYRWAEEGGYKFLAANMVKEATGEIPAYCQPYGTYTTPEGVKVGVLGLVTTGVPTLVRAANVAGLKFFSAKETAEKYVPIMKAEGCEIIIVLSHMGSSEARGAAIEGVDAIFAAHTHALENTSYNGVPILQGSNNGRYISRFVIEYNYKSGKKSISAVNVDLYNNKNSLTADPYVKGLVDQYNAALAPILEEVVGYHETGIEGNMQKVGEWGDELVYQHILDEEYAPHIVFSNSGGWRVDYLPKGDIKMSYLYTLMPFDNFIVLMDITGTQLLVHLNKSGTFNYSYGAKKVGDNFYLLDGTPIIPEGTYKVACNDFMFTGGDGYDFVTGVSNAQYIGDWREGMAQTLKSRLPKPEPEPEAVQVYDGANLPAVKDLTGAGLGGELVSTPKSPVIIPKIPVTGRYVTID